MVGRTRATELARRLGVGLRECRLAAGLRQVDVADRAGVSQAWISKMERGLGQSASLETWASVAAALGLLLAAFLEDVPGADRPRDYEHLKRQRLVIDTAAKGGWHPFPELAIDAGPGRSRCVDVLLGRPSTGEVLVVEIWDFFEDVGAALRSLDGKVATLAARNEANDPTASVRGAFVVRGTQRNRALVHEFQSLFRARFAGSSWGLLAALTDPSCSLPRADTLLWTDVAGARLMPSRLTGSGSGRPRRAGLDGPRSAGPPADRP